MPRLPARHTNIKTQGLGRVTQALLRDAGTLGDFSHSGSEKIQENFKRLWTNVNKEFLVLVPLPAVADHLGQFRVGLFEDGLPGRLENLAPGIDSYFVIVFITEEDPTDQIVEAEISCLD